MWLFKFRIREVWLADKGTLGLHRELSRAGDRAGRIHTAANADTWCR